MEKDGFFIGNMDRRITVLRKATTKTNTGAETKADQEIATVWAERKTASSDKKLDEKVVALNVVLYSIHYHPDIKNENIQDLYVVDDGVEFEIYGFDYIGRKKYVKLKCQLRE